MFQSFEPLLLFLDVFHPRRLVLKISSALGPFLPTYRQSWDHDASVLSFKSSCGLEKLFRTSTSREPQIFPLWQWLVSFRSSRDFGLGRPNQYRWGMCFFFNSPGFRSLPISTPLAPAARLFSGLSPGLSGAEPY